MDGSLALWLYLSNPRGHPSDHSHLVEDPQRQSVVQSDACYSEIATRYDFTRPTR